MQCSANTRVLKRPFESDHFTSYKTRRRLRCRPMQPVSSSKTDDVAAWIEDNMNSGTVTNQKFCGGSSWSSCYIYETSQGRNFFVKRAMGRSAKDMFEGEALGLNQMHSTHTVRVPKVYHYGDFSSGSFIVMEHLNMRGSADQATLGKKLALMHAADPADFNAKQGKFGFAVNNTIGGTPQPNEWSDIWVEFFREKRLGHQLKLANDKTLTTLGDTLCSGLENFFKGIEVIKPSILHGDLWSGNITAVDGEPCVFDPACYYGHHEAEFGMSWCAGFSGSFWAGYHSVIPRDEGWDQRHDLYSLYHYLNHYNLFGGGYYTSCVQIMERLNRQLYM